MKGLGLIIIFFTFTLSGFLKADKLKRRANFLAETESALYTFENLVSTSGVPLPEALASTKNPLFCRGGELLEKLGTDGFLKAVSEFSITGREEDALLLFGKGLCAADKEGQIKNARLCIGTISRLRVEADNSVTQKAKLYVTSGVLSGAMVFIALV